VEAQDPRKSEAQTARPNVTVVEELIFWEDIPPPLAMCLSSF
jgi:hypothetical protein